MVTSLGVVAILLVGHSNAGKSPLGALLEARSAELRVRRWLHLDFGERLRATVAGALDAGPLRRGDVVPARRSCRAGCWTMSTSRSPRK